MAAFIFAEHAHVAAELVSCVNSQDERCVLVLIGSADNAFLAAGASEAVVLKGSSRRPEDYAKAIADMLKSEGARLFVVESTVRGRELAASVSGYLGCAMHSDVATLGITADAVSVTRNTYGGAAISHETSCGISVVTVTAGTFEARTLPPTTAVREATVQVESRIRLVDEQPLVKGGVDLSAAERIVSVGLGLDKQEDLSIIEGLSQALNAEIGCTRDMAENRGWIPKSQYIGITGAIVKPSLYVAVGLSGAMQHVYGIRNAKVVVGINKDENAPIFRAADYGIVGDLYEVVPQLTEAIANR